MISLRTCVALVIFGTAALASAGSTAKPSKPGSASTVITSPQTEQEWMIEGEQRYRTNCGRCHQPPHKFPPHAMAMAVRHMRVRAMLTEDDMKYLLYYMTH